MSTWQLQEAKAQLSEVVRLCSSEGPQVLTVRGKEEAVLVSKAEYDKLTGKKPSFIKFMRSSPLYGINLVIERDKSMSREVKL
jgi:prevent-host-death family protein